MGLSPMVEDVKPDSEICRLDYDSQLFCFSNILSVVCFISHVIQTKAMQNVFFRDNGPYFQNKIENVPFESCQEKKSLIRRQRCAASQDKPHQDDSRFNRHRGQHSHGGPGHRRSRREEGRSPAKALTKAGIGR